MWLTETHNDGFFDELNLKILQIDEFFVKFVRLQRAPGDLWLLTKYKDCYKCPYILRHPLPAIQMGKYMTMKSLPAEDWRLMNAETYVSYPNNWTNVICSSSPEFGEFGVYAFNTTNCEVAVLKQPVSIYAGILTVSLLLSLFIALGFGIIYAIQLLKEASRRCNKATDEKEMEKDTKKQRVQSLDTFRGISVVIMIFVNYGAGKYEFLEHATWNGLNLADCVFPWFMWIMGVCIPMSIRSATKGDASHFCIFINILRRSFILFMLGVFLNQGVELEKIRIFGVLQRFSVCYLVVASLELLFSRYKSTQAKTDFGRRIHDVLILIPEWTLILILTTIHLVIIFHLEVPGCPKGYLGPGGWHENGLYKNCTGGATGYIDKKILGFNHTYQHPTAKIIYESQAFDPEGFFGTLMSILQVFIGVQAGTTLQVFRTHKERLVRWITWGTVLGIIAGGLCGFSKEDGIIPINKNLWSLSFVLATSCLAFYLLSLCYTIIDISHLWSGKPFLFAGMNATIMYVGHSLTFAFPFLWALTPMNTHYLYLAVAVWSTSLWIVIAYLLFRNKFFLSI